MAAIFAGTAGIASASEVHPTLRSFTEESPTGKGETCILTKLTTFEGHLPQGAPTSTYLANLLIVSLEPSILSACRSLNIKYSTWVDDLAFSGSNAPDVIGKVVTVLRSVGLSVSHKKLKVMRPGSRIALNGVVIGNDLNLTSEYRRAIRSGIYKLRMGAVRQGFLVRYIRSLKGRIDYLSSINPKAGERFSRDLMSAIAEIGLEGDQSRSN